MAKPAQPLERASDSRVAGAGKVLVYVASSLGDATNPSRAHVRSFEVTPEPASGMLAAASLPLAYIAWRSRRKF